MSAPSTTNRLGNVEISLRLNGDRRYRPGEMISGQVLLQARETFEVVFAEAILFFRTEGMGNRDEGRAAVMSLAPPGRQIMRTLEATLQFEAPPSPVTYYGNLLKVHWMVGIYVQGKGREVYGLLELPVIIHQEPDSLSLPETIPGNEGKPVSVVLA